MAAGPRPVTEETRHTGTPVRCQTHIQSTCMYDHMQFFSSLFAILYFSTCASGLSTKFFAFVDVIVPKDLETLGSLVCRL